ncbi:MAG TPA: shikimate kinase AroK [Pseudomonadales bacterium]
MIEALTPPETVVFLVGPMGAGKSTIGPLLAEELGWPFCDTDHEIEARAGVDIPWIFDVEGEAGFRRRESEVLEVMSAEKPLVLATGGGIILADANRKLMKERGIVIYLSATLDQLLSRTARDRKRPLLQGGNPRDKIRALMATRAPLYEAVADITCMTDERNPRIAARELVKQLSVHLSG